MENIKGKVVAITGASSGMGKAIAIELAKNGAKIALGARRTIELQHIAAQIKSKGGEAIFVQTDVKNKADLIRLVNTAVERYGKLDVIVNNAGVSQLSRFDELDIDGWEEMIDINLKGVLYGMAAAIPVFKHQRSGHIVNIISTSGIKIVPMQSIYAGTKNAIRTIAEAFRQESDGNIRITGISPGFVKTDFADNIKNEEMKKAIQKGMEQIAIDPIAIANAVIYAVSQPNDVEIGDIVIRPSKQN
ncbi:SDR family oxidoreductase [Chryseobacterium fluminis]|uniref:SDR family oxidoreductase n=1 Tax=Chryseobacterium fluminis TaxID=2983606 RepID=UPI00225793DD|nr:SDR family oxidoreductase [Chryseobacterium sp. MMS21-Ot14]UZT99992.1 SDR family oxidoreductase [Chryseobacterium sp. MMS21-Ot14]